MEKCPLLFSNLECAASPCRLERPPVEFRSSVSSRKSDRQSRLSKPGATGKRDTVTRDSRSTKPSLTSTGRQSKSSPQPRPSSLQQSRPSSQQSRPSKQSRVSAAAAAALEPVALKSYRLELEASTVVIEVFGRCCADDDDEKAKEVKLKDGKELRFGFYSDE